jgi:hypothetical protein
VPINFALFYAYSPILYLWYEMQAQLEEILSDSNKISLTENPTRNPTVFVD